MLQHPGEQLPWNTVRPRNVQPHDEQQQSSNNKIKNYFTPGKFYCVETICAPCGVVIAWTKFEGAESPSNVMRFLEEVFPTEESRPDYVCIDKACLVLRYLLNDARREQWETWKKTTRFSVDSYHYTNHRVKDFLCRIFCNPAPLDGSAPNLVVTDVDNNGNPYLKRAFNTQACEQLNAWLGGFESTLKKMTPSNFDWFLHTMLFYHSRHVIDRQARRRRQEANGMEVEEDVAENDDFPAEDIVL
ncbi:hypothetical protein BDQ17DRAFT_1267594 [Cyathus striatus]|nr:hypothetical protein BDQ17DRAFT_1267594 [Cyathus striatus]